MHGEANWPPVCWHRLTKIPQLVEAHPNHKREVPIDGETRFRHVLHHRDDKNRELVLTVLAFDVPTQTDEEAGDAGAV